MGRRVLLVAESVTLAQVVRLTALAKGLAPSRYEVHFACSEFAPIVFENAQFRTWPLRATDRRKVLEKVERGEWAYDETVLAEYVEDELSLIDRIKPDIVIGDFRLSLAISAPLRQVPYAALINAYWSPYAVHNGFPVPDHPIVNLVGLARATKYFPQALPLAFKRFAEPVNKLRRRHGLPPVGSLLEVLTFGDFTLYPDSPELCPTQKLPPTHRFLGHIPWSPQVELPESVQQGDPGVPLIYATLGSSGNLTALKAALTAIGGMPVRALLATAGRRVPVDVPGNVVVTDFVPGDEVARKAAVVVTNGGASTSYQALAVGTPVLGLPSNLDQYLAMTAIERTGAGRLVRAGCATAEDVRAGLSYLLESSLARQQAERLRESFAKINCHAEFSNVLETAFS